MPEHAHEPPSPGAHDVGGRDFGPIDRAEHDLALWEKRVDAMLILLATKKGAFKIDAMRRAIESYGEQQYHETTYYEKWARAVRNLLLEQEVITREELDDAVDRAAAEFRAQGREVIDARVPPDPPPSKVER